MVKIFYSDSSDNFEALESRINDFLSQPNIECIDRQFCVYAGLMYVMITYKDKAKTL